MEFSSFQLQELRPHMEDAFRKPGSTVPLSPLRLESYLSNPRAEANDPVLFELRQGNELLAYRTLLPDLFYDEAGQAHRFAWLSGNWVRSDMRRKGISKKLLKHCEEAWDGNLMYTNYAPASKSLYDGTGHFKVVREREGKRYYLRSSVRELLGQRSRAPELLGLGDRLVNGLRERSLRRGVPDDIKDFHPLPFKNFSEPLTKLTAGSQEESLFRRDSSIFRWALDKPWISELEEPSLKYHFSYEADRFENILLDCSHEDSSGWIWILLHEGACTVPYVFYEDEKLLPLISRELYRIMVLRGCGYLTLRHPELSKAMKPYRKRFLSIRSLPQSVFMHEKLEAKVPVNLNIQDGDGDVMFTG